MLHELTHYICVPPVSSSLPWQWMRWQLHFQIGHTTYRCTKSKVLQASSEKTHLHRKGKYSCILVLLFGQFGLQQRNNYLINFNVSIASESKLAKQQIPLRSKQ